MRYALLSTRARPIAALTLIGEDYLATHLRLVSRLVVHAIRFVFRSHLVATCDLAALHSPPAQNTELHINPFSCLLGLLHDRHVELVVILVSVNRELASEVHVMGVFRRKRDCEKRAAIPCVLFNPLCNRLDRLLAVILVLCPVLPERLLEIQLHFLELFRVKRRTEDRLCLGSENLADHRRSMRRALRLMVACPIPALAVVLENGVATRLRLVSRLVVHTLGAMLLRSLHATNELLALV